MNYLEWNNLLAKYFFNEEKSGKEVLLYVNEDLINELGKPRGDDINNFLESTKQGPRWITRSGVCQKALQSFEGWRNKGFEYPPYISYLACFVLAAGTHEDCAPQAYYPRLRKLLNEEDNIGQLPSFNKMILLWDDLDKWSREDKQE
ncbi:MAG: hypothetical protein U9Q92_03535, partial [archaeon]|nr:hypothetical protein [archaeon]